MLQFRTQPRTHAIHKLTRLGMTYMAYYASLLSCVVWVRQGCARKIRVPHYSADIFCKP